LPQINDEPLIDLAFAAPAAWDIFPWHKAEVCKSLEQTKVAHVIQSINGMDWPKVSLGTMIGDEFGRVSDECCIVCWNFVVFL